MIRDVFPFSQTQWNAHMDGISRFSVHRSLKNRSLDYVLAWMQSRPIKPDRIREEEP